MNQCKKKKTKTENMITINGRLHAIKNTRNHTVACTKSHKYKEPQECKQQLFPEKAGNKQLLRDFLLY